MTLVFYVDFEEKQVKTLIKPICFVYDPQGAIFEAICNSVSPMTE